MTAPRLEIDLAKIHHNARSLVDQAAARGISVTGVTKATLGSPEIAEAMIEAGVSRIGDSRIENIEAMRRAHVVATMMLLRSPMPSQVDRVVAHADVSCNTELDVIHKLSRAAHEACKSHGIVLMVELGDLREGILASDLLYTARETLRLPNLTLQGIGANLACRSGVSPDSGNMSRLSSLARSIEQTLDVELDLVSGGSSANLDWALGDSDPGRVNDLRLGESILLGREPLHRRSLEGLHTDAVTLVAEVIESKVKPSKPWGDLAQNAFGEKPMATTDRGYISQALLAIGRQDTTLGGLGAPTGIEILAASSDHLIVETDGMTLAVGAEVSFQLDYSALLGAMTSPFVGKVWKATQRSCSVTSAAVEARPAIADQREPLRVNPPVLNLRGSAAEPI